MQLKNCPFCGSQRLKVTTVSAEHARRLFFVACTCGANGAPYQNKGAAIKNWNQRKGGLNK